MPDVVREVTRQGWGSRIGGSIVAALVGVVLFLLSFPLLFWNEGRAVTTAKTLAEGAGTVTSVSAERVEPQTEGKLVHVSGLATTDEILSDAEFAVSANAIQLQRRVEMYQWKQKESRQTRNKLGGGTETVTTYSYTKTWADHPIRSSEFKSALDHVNPEELPFPNTTKTAERVTLGAFMLSPSLVGQIDSFETLPMNEDHRNELSDALRMRLKLHDGAFFQGEDPANPRVGDARVSFRVVKPTTVSLVSQQIGNSFQPFRAQAGGQIERLMVGSYTAEQIFDRLKLENTMLTWGLRFGGYLAMAIGLGLILGPLGVVADVIPFVGNLMRVGTGLVAGFLAATFSLITISIAWIVYRPILGVLLLLLAVGTVILLKKLASRRKISMATANPM